MIGKLTVTVIGTEKQIKDCMQDIESIVWAQKFDMHSFKWDFNKSDEALEGEITESKSKKLFSREGLYG